MSRARRKALRGRQLARAAIAAKRAQGDAPDQVCHDDAVSVSGEALARPHLPVLLDAVLAQLLAAPALERDEGPLLLDGTLGAGGHAAALLAARPGLRLLGLDRDEAALSVARLALEPFGERVTLRHARFADAARVLEAEALPRATTALFDLGVSSMQLDSFEGGMSFSREAPLDMRMGLADQTALELMSRASETELADLLFNLGGERLSRRIAKLIKEWLADGSLQTTLDLARLCAVCYGGLHGQRIHPATRTFQALRMAVNGELEELEAMLKAAPEFMAPGGRLAVISFHSLEDGAVKRRFAQWQAEGRAQSLTKKPLIADEAAVRFNRRARSAKLRVCQWGDAR